LRFSDLWQLKALYSITINHARRPPARREQLARGLGSCSGTPRAGDRTSNLLVVPGLLAFDVFVVVLVLVARVEVQVPGDNPKANRAAKMANKSAHWSN